MAKDRKICCIHYESKGVCAISSKECTINGEMQHCPMYEPAKNSKPMKTNRRKERREKESRRRNWEE
jgi:hypothetical protein